MLRRFVLAPPLDPSPDEARDALRRELLDPRYHQQNPLQAALDWIERTLERSLDAASGAPTLSAVAAIVVFAALCLALALLASRARTSARARREVGDVITEERVGAEQLRARALAAQREGRHDDAVVEGFRALARRQVERGLLPDDPGATAREVATVLGAAHEARRDRVDEAAGLFEAVLYGGEPATHEQAARVLALDDDLAGVR